jgi:NAD dependent epimerase/dehydratase family enzyme
VLLASQRVKPSVALETGYRFHHPELKGALADLFSARDRAARAD